MQVSRTRPAQLDRKIAMATIRDELADDGLFSTLAGRRRRSVRPGGGGSGGSGGPGGA
jgi:hypothetical protein